MTLLLLYVLCVDHRQKNQSQSETPKVIRPFAHSIYNQLQRSTTWTMSFTAFNPHTGLFSFFSFFCLLCSQKLKEEWDSSQDWFTQITKKYVSLYLCRSLVLFILEFHYNTMYARKLRRDGEIIPERALASTM